MGIELEARAVKISPSLLACDFARIGEEAAGMERAGADMLHLDVMDGHFVPNISMGPPVIASIRKATGMFLDVHLMISRPLDYINAFVEAGSDLITFHVESESDVSETLGAIKARGVKCGLVLKPGTSASEAERFLPQLDMVLVMTVEPGFGGQRFMADMLPKIRELRVMADKLCPGLDIEVDGGIDLNTAPLVVEAGANVLVAGSSLFSQPNYAEAVQKLRQG